MSKSLPVMYLATVLAGLENVLQNEIEVKIADATAFEVQRGRVLFRSAESPDRLLALRSVDNVFVLIDRFTVGPHRAHLRNLEDTVAGIDLDVQMAVLRQFVGEDAFDWSHFTYFVNASRSGKHTYSRFEAADAVIDGILTRNPNWQTGTTEEHDVEFRLDIVGDEALFALRLTPPTFRFRGEERWFAQAALRPTVAHGLVWLSSPEATDRFLDPFCGSGTILSERLAYPVQSIRGGDLSEEVVETARQNVASDSHEIVQCWDARHLPVDANSVNKIVSNLPFGKQILNETDIGALYAEFMRELSRVMTADGVAWLLTDQVVALATAAEKMQLRCESLLELSLKGLHPHVFRVTQR